MKHFEKSRERGIITYIVMIIIALILIAYFRNDIQGFLTSARTKDAILTAINWMQTGLQWIISKLNWTSSQIK